MKYKVVMKINFDETKEVEAEDEDGAKEIAWTQVVDDIENDIVDSVEEITEEAGGDKKED